MMSARSSSRCFASRSAAQPASSIAAASTRSAAPWVRLSIGSAPLRPVLEAEVHQALEQLCVGDAVGARRLRKILGGLEIGVGIGFEHVHLAFFSHPEVHASIA